MKRFVFFILASCMTLGLVAQQKAFRSTDVRLKVYAGDTVSILVDSAYVVSAAQALLLNEKLLALKEAQRVNAEWFAFHEDMRHQLQEMEVQVARLLDRLKSDEQLLESHFVQLLAELDQSVTMLAQNNQQLQVTNEQLEAQLGQLEKTLAHLKQQNHRLWWRQLRDKLLIGLAGLGIGLLIGAQ